MRLWLLTWLLFETSAFAFAGSPEERCETLRDNVVAAHQKLATFLPPKMTPVAAITSLLAIKPSACADEEDAADMINTVYDAVGEHSGKVGVIIRYKNEKDAAIVEGFRAVPHSEKLIVKQVVDDPKAVQQALAELVLVHQVAAIMGGTQRRDATLLAEWAAQLRIAFINLAPFSYLGAKRSRFAFTVFPSEMKLAQKMAQYLTQKNYKKIAILRPARNDAVNFSNNVARLVKKAGIDASIQWVYFSSDYASLEDAVKRLFKIDRKLREKEFKDLYEKMKKEAEDKKIPFNPNQVILPPLVEVDAVIIPDNFRIVRHIAKIMQFHGVRSLPLVGHQQWRAPELVEPTDPFLNGAVFVDYIGRYDQLPDVLTGGGNSENPFFIASGEANKLDYRLVGYRAAHIMLTLLHSEPQKRYGIADKLMKFEMPAQGPFANGAVFTPQRMSQWPAFMLKVQERSLQMVAETAVAHSPSP